MKGQEVSKEIFLTTEAFPAAIYHYEKNRNGFCGKKRRFERRKPAGMEAGINNFLGFVVNRRSGLP
jgi:hypothetical protein